MSHHNILSTVRPFERLRPTIHYRFNLTDNSIDGEEDHEEAELENNDIEDTERRQILMVRLNNEYQLYKRGGREADMPLFSQREAL